MDGVLIEIQEKIVDSTHMLILPHPWEIILFESYFTISSPFEALKNIIQEMIRIKKILIKFGASA